MSKLFRTKREELGRNISEAAASTRIKESCLVAIEEEDYGKLPIEVYARGYIKEYAKYLDLPVDAGLPPYDRYLETRKSPKEKKPAVPAFGQPSRAAQRGGEELKGYTTDSEICKEGENQLELFNVGNRLNAIKIYGNKILWKGVLLAVVILAIVYQFISSRTAERESQVVPTSQQMQPSKDVSPNAVAQTPAASLPTAGEMKGSEIVPGKKRHELVISAEDVSWVQVNLDGTEKKEALLKRGESMTVEADNSIGVVVGNAGGVSLKFDGNDLPAGKKGEVLRLMLPDKPKIGKSDKDVLKPGLQETPVQVEREAAVPGKLSGEKGVINKLPEQSASPVKP